MSNAAKKLIVAPQVGHEGVTLTRYITVGLGSAVFNSTMLGLVALVFWLLGGLRAEEAPPPPAQVTEVEEPPRDFDLTNTDVGLDDSVQLNFNVDRIEDVSVPGPVDPTAPVGIVNAPEAAPSN